MSKNKKRSHHRRSAPATPAPEVGRATLAATSRSSARYVWALVAGAVLAIGGILFYWYSGLHPNPLPGGEGKRGDILGEKKGAQDTPAVLGTPAAQYVGGKACAACHAKEYEAWRGSHHDLAMQEASEHSVLGNFSDARLAYAGVTSTFFKRDGKFYVKTDSPDGKLADYEIKYTFGFTPLQQYLIEFPGGRLQALGLAWDARPKAQGGSRWFHLYPDRTVKAGNPLHWSGIDQNWNYQCADCHSTNLRKNYDEKTSAFATKWSEINVGCEACHGPGSNHTAWAKKEGDWRRFESGKGLALALDERKGVSWAIDPASGDAVRSKPRDSNREVDACARCHARRGQFSDDYAAGQPLHDAFRPSLIEPGLYHADGQQRDEVYNYASFLQSKMHAQGVTCSDCHDPHSGKPRAAGNAACTQCHLGSKYEAPEHHRHAMGSKGVECAACHMPTTTYMVVDPRHDHSFRIPRPDRTVALGAPNACNGCHTKKSAQWAADAVRRWYPQAKPGFQSFAEAFHATERGAPAARGMLMSIVEDRAQPAMVRASAVARLGRYLSPITLPTVTNALNDADADVRRATVAALSVADAATRLRFLPRMLDDPSRVVRMDAARALAGETEPRLPAEARATFEKALAEYEVAQRFNADRPESQANLGGLHQARGRIEDAVAAYRKALVIDPTYTPAAANLADLHRTRGEEVEAERVLRSVLKSDPGSAIAYHALGLALVRQKRTPEALPALQEATKRAPDNPRFAYVYGVALHDAGKRAEAMKRLEAALVRYPYDREILFALASFEIEAGNRAKAADRARLLRELEPENRDFARLAAQAALP